MDRRVPPPSRVCALIVAAAVVGLLSACSGGDGHRRLEGDFAPSGRGAGSTWIFARRALNQVSADGDVRARLGAARIFEVARFTHPPRAQPGVIPTVKFTSYAGLKQAIANGGLPSWVKAVLYDNEPWSFTPEVEQRAPGPYTEMAAALAHRHHLLFLASPALGLTAVLRPGVTRRATAYLQLGLAAQAARAADVVNLQAQSLERSTSAYVAFVREAAAQARRARPGVTVLAGISSNPTGPPVTAAQLIGAMAGARRYVDGYWMNIPSPGAACPRCNAPRPDLAIAAIRSLRR